MYEVIKSTTFDVWVRSLKDRVARTRIHARVKRLSLGNPGDYRALKSGIFELKIDHGPGYRVYYTFKENKLVLLLCGGDKSSQSSDIKHAIELAKEWRDGDES